MASKWDNISKKDAAQLMSRIMYLDVSRSTGEFMAHEIRGIDLYTGHPTDARSFSLYKREEYEELCEDFVISKDSMVPTLAEILYQLPKRFAHKIDAFRLDLMRSYKDGVTGENKIGIIYYKLASNADTEEQSGTPLTARQMYMDLLVAAMDAPQDRPEILRTTSLRDATRDKKQMEKLRVMLKEAETMDEALLPQAISYFWLEAWRQR